MNLSLRNRHRMIWLIFAFTIPFMLAYAMNLGLSKRGMHIEIADEAVCGELGTRTEVASYYVDHGNCMYGIQVIPNHPLRKPQLAVVVSSAQIDINNIGATQTTYFEGKASCLISFNDRIQGTYHVVLLDMLRREELDRVKLVVQ